MLALNMSVEARLQITTNLQIATSGIVFTDECSVLSLFSLWIKVLKLLFSVI